MRKNYLMTAAIVLIVLMIPLLFINVNTNDQEATSTPYLTAPYFSSEANEIFASSVVGAINLNSGVTMERAMPLYPNQINNITFAVFNHTDEPIIFPDQGFGLTVFAYDEINKDWERLQLRHVPYSQSKTLPPKLETWDFEINNGWDILENDVVALAREQIRLYVTGKGKATDKTYSAYLDITISTSP